MAKNRVAGTAFVRYNGKQLSIAGSIEVSPLGTMKEGLSGLSGVAGYKETPRVPFFEVEAYDTSSLNLKELEGLDDMTVTAELANGKIWTLRNAWLAGEPGVNGAEGTVPIRFEGIECVPNEATE